MTHEIKFNGGDLERLTSKYGNNSFKLVSDILNKEDYNLYAQGVATNTLKGIDYKYLSLYSNNEDIRTRSKTLYHNSKHIEDVL